MTESDPAAAAAALSDGLALAAEAAGASTVLVDARRRIPASGIAWSDDGLIVTADHILERDEEISVTLPEGRPVTATLIGREPGSDLAVLKVEAKTSPARRAGDARVGELVLALGRPEPSIMASFGVVSAVGKPWQTATGLAVDGLIRSDTTFFPGFSGGPLTNVKGEVIGLNSSRLGRGGGLTIPASSVDRVVAALVQHGHLRRGYLGITSQPVEAGSTSGLLVVGVADGSPASEAGVLIGDILTRFGEETVDAGTDLRRHLGPDSVGRRVELGVLRGGNEATVGITIGERPDAPPADRAGGRGRRARGRRRGR